MIPLSLGDIAAIVGGELHFADAAALVTGPASVDSRSVEAGGLFVAVVGEHVDGHDFVDGALSRGASGVLASRVVDAPCIVVPDVTTALAQLAHEVVRRIPALVIAITGSAGKTSVKDLVAHVLEHSGPTVAAVGSFNNDLGVPLTVLRADAGTRFLVLEMGARGLGHISRLCKIAKPDIGAVLNVGSAHAEVFGSAETTALAKAEMVESLDPEDVAVLNADDWRTARMAVHTAARIVTFGDRGMVKVGRVTLDASGEPHFALGYNGARVDAHLPQLGAHQASNAAAAAAICLAAGLDLNTIVERLATATARSPMRLARTLREDGVLIVDDTYNANPESVEAALRTVAHLRAPGRRIAAVLGEMLEIGPDGPEKHRQLGTLAATLDFDLVVAVGDGAAPVAAGAGRDAIAVADTDAAAEAVSAWLRPGDVVLVKASRGARLERVTAALGA